ncbi:MAG TPA: amidohydrolase family protein [Terracidiphilus sp.]|nr:amidohydrolase family protein [Terracidiphilus sp.]
METSDGISRRKFLAASAMAGVAAGAAIPALGKMPNKTGDPAMSSGPQSTDLLIMGADIVTFDNEDKIISDGAIAVQGNAIAWLGKAEDAKTMFTAKDTVNASGLIAMPGFTDTHYHTAQQFLRGVHKMSRRKGPGWKKSLIPFESGLEPDDVYASGIVGYTSMISAGTTCFLEAGGPHPDEMGRAANDVGIRGRISLNTCDMDGEGGPLPKSHIMSTEQALKENEALVKRWKNHPRVNAWLSLRQILVNTEELRVNMSHLADELNTVIHTHLSEGTYEVDYAIENYGLRPPAYFEKLGIFNSRMHCAHSVLLTTPEVDLYAKHDVSVGHCAFHNYYLAPHRMFDMVRQNIRVGLGTDGPGSRGTLDMFQVMRYAVMGQTIEYGMPYHAQGPISYPEMLKYALRNGARAAHLGDKTGSLEVGKLADIVLTARDDFDQYPSFNPLVTLAEMTTGMNVRTVVIDGKVVMKNREFLTIDMEPTRQRMSKQYKVIQDRYDAYIATA